MFYVIASIGDTEGPITLPSGKPRPFDTYDTAARVAATLQARVKVTRYRVVEIEGGHRQDAFIVELR